MHVAQMVIMRAPHPGETLKAELAERNLSANQFSLIVQVPANRIGDILRGRRGISADTAIRLAEFFNNSPQFWMGLQSNHDLYIAKQKRMENEK